MKEKLYKISLKLMIVVLVTYKANEILTTMGHGFGT
ncbi:hypothetical protein PTI45_03991 [Paenibacillus nuruki]|uniref:Uncharacterized protein n=1 Tax=Paenibacillus nuruki TaxID=1886670 RepID=A0A1E3KZ40_9BACL|nr:hypothetical protein PTI45_03991 [Paenibacillus nuruki]